MHIDKSDIQLQLEKILGSPTFKSSELLSKFLSYVVTQTLAGNGKNLKAYTIAIEAFGRNSNFDPQQDSIVRNYAAKLRKELSHYYNEYGVNDKIRIEIPKGIYIPEFSLITSNNHIDSKSETSSGNKKSVNIYRLVIVLLALIIVTILVIKFSPQAGIRNERPAIVFYEFQNLTSNPANDLWVRSLSEEITILSSGFAEIDIIGPVSKIDVSGQELEELINTENLFVLDGSVVALDSLLKVNVRLLEYNTKKVLWAQMIQKEISPESLMEIEYEISNNIASKVSSIYGVVQYEVLKKSTNAAPTNLSSHLSVLKYYQYLRNFAYEDYTQIKRELENTTIEDPEYGIAWSALATVYMDGYWYFDEDSVSSFSKAQYCLDKALKLDPENVFVQSHRVYISYASHNLTDFYHAIDQVEKLNPSNVMIGEIGVFLVLIGDDEKGLELINKSQKLSIVYPGYFHGGSFLYYYRKGEFEKALIEAEKINMPEFFIDPLFRMAALFKLNRIEDARQVKKDLLSIKPDFTTNGYSILKRISYQKRDINSIMRDFNFIEEIL